MYQEILSKYERQKSNKMGVHVSRCTIWIKLYIVCESKHEY
jgi:hypothetical protein